MKLQKEFNQYLADTAVMIFKLHNLHWNVEGMQFKPVHDMTEAAYDTLFGFMDEIAEHQKMYGYIPDSKASDYLANAQIKEVDAKKFTPKEVIDLVISDYEHLRKEATELRHACDEEKWFSAVSLLEDHVSYYNKQLWFMKAMLG